MATPIVVLAHLPMWTIYPQWGWGTEDAGRALSYLKLFGSVTVSDVVDAVRSAEFDTACTTIPGTARSSTDPYRLPRRLVMDWGRLRFRTQMQRWKLG